MAWLSENWLYLLALAGVMLFMRLGGMRCGFGRPHAHERRDAGPSTDDTSANDPVSGRAVDPRSAVATLYHGQAYYFESRDNRDRFEGDPASFAGPSAERKASPDHRQHHGGCC